MDALVRLDHVSKSYGSASALKPTSLTIERGRTTVLIGGSACILGALLFAALVGLRVWTIRGPQIVPEGVE